MTTAIRLPNPTGLPSLNLRSFAHDQFQEPAQVAVTLGCSYDKIVIACKLYRERTESYWDQYPETKGHFYPQPTESELACLWEYFGRRLGYYLVYTPTINNLRLNTEAHPLNSKGTGRRVGWTRANNWGKPQITVRPHPGVRHSWITHRENGQEWRECPLCHGRRNVPPYHQKLNKPQSSS